MLLVSELSVAVISFFASRYLTEASQVFTASCSLCPVSTVYVMFQLYVLWDVKMNKISLDYTIEKRRVDLALSSDNKSMLSLQCERKVLQLIFVDNELFFKEIVKSVSPYLVSEAMLICTNKDITARTASAVSF